MLSKLPTLCIDLDIDIANELTGKRKYIIYEISNALKIANIMIDLDLRFIGHTEVAIS